MDCFAAIQHHFKQQPDKTAVVLVKGRSETDSLLYSELHKRIIRLRALFRNKGLVPGDTVLVLSGLSPQSLSVMLACFSMGLTAVPVNPRLALNQLLDILNDVKPVLVIIEHSLHEGIKRVLMGRVKNTINIADKIPESCREESAFCFIEHKARPVLLMHTSGSSGKAKGIAYSLAQLKTFMRCQDFLYRQYSDVKGEEVYASDLIVSLPLHHFGGLSLCLQSLMMGRTLHVLKDFLPVDYMQVVRRQKVRLLMMVPSMLEQVLALPDIQASARSVKYCITLGEPCSERLRKEIENTLGAEVYSAYGLSECQTGIGHHRLQIDAGEVAGGSCGRLLFGEVKLLDGDKMESNYGELWVRNDTSFACYTSIELNQQRFDNGWFATGDLLRKDQQGNYFYCGRKDNMFIVNGKNIYPEEIEQVLSTFPCVQTVVVVPLASACGKVFPGALIKMNCTDKKHLVSKENIIDYYLQKGAVHATPGWLCWLDEFPKNSTGKIDKVKCAALLQRDYETHFCRLAS